MFAVEPVYCTVLVPDGLNVPVTDNGEPVPDKVMVPDVGDKFAPEPTVKIPVTV